MKKPACILLGLMIFALTALGGCGDKASTEGKKGEGGKKTYTVGVTQIVEHPSLDAAFAGFKKGMADAGLKEGVNVKYVVKNAQNDKTTNQTIADAFAADKVDLIFANSTPSAQAALNATKDIPIVFTSVTDPVGSGLVQSIENPGGNVTGTSDTHPEAIPDTIKFMNGQFNFKNVGTIYNAGETNSVAQIRTIKEAMKGTGLKLVEKTVTNSSEVLQAAQSLVGKVDAIYIVTDNTVVSAFESVLKVADENDIPVFAGELDSVRRGAFAAYGFEYSDIGYQAGQMAAKILKDGKKPADIPVEYPKHLKLLINKTAAEKMGVHLKPEWDGMAEYFTQK